MRLRLTVFLLLVLGAGASAPLQSQTPAQPSASALGDRARDVERRLAVIPGHESAKATVRFPFQGNIPATQRGRGYDATAEAKPYDEKPKEETTCQPGASERSA